MKQEHVKVGEEYMTKVSGALVKVKVDSVVEARRPGQRMRFEVSRVDNGRRLTNRTAAKLRPSGTVVKKPAEARKFDDPKKGTLSQKELEALEALDY